MTGLEKIIKQIQDEAQQSAQEILAEGKAQAERLSQEALEDGRKQVQEIEARSQTAVRNAQAAAKSAADLTIRRAVLEAKQEIINQVIQKAQDSIYALPDKDYFDLLLKMVSKFSLPQAGEIQFSKKDLGRMPAGFEEAINTAAKGSLTLSATPCEIDGGFVLVYGGVEENCSIGALFYAAQESLQDKAQAILFA